MTNVELPMSKVIKLASLVVHVEEMLSPNGQAPDKYAVEALLADPEVQDFVEALRALSPALLPVKR